MERSTVVLSRVVLFCLSLIMSACGQVNLSITDAPVDSVDAINLAISGVVFEANDGETTEIDISPAMVVNLMTLTEGVTEQLVSSESLDKGSYRKVTLKLDVNASFVSVDGTDYNMTMPTDAESGLEVSKNFEVSSGNDVNLVIDFDLRKSVRPRDGNNDYVLRPSMRLLVEAETGSVTGSINNDLLSLDTQCFDSAGVVSAVVYVFSGNDVSPDDVDGTSTDPLTSARVNPDLSYTAAFLEEGDYTVSLTCEALKDSPAVNDDLNFLRSYNVSVVKSQSILQDFNS